MIVILLLGRLMTCQPILGVSKLAAQSRSFIHQFLRLPLGLLGQVGRHEALHRGLRSLGVQLPR